MAKELNFVMATGKELDNAAEKMVRHFKTFGLDREVVEHLWLLPLASIYGKKGVPYVGKTNADIFNKFVSEIASCPRTFEATAIRLRTTPELLMAAEHQMYISLFKGVNKQLPIPIVVSEFSPSIYNVHENAYSASITTAHPVCYLNEDDLVALSPKNLEKHYGYPTADAKAMFKNLRGYPHNGKFFLVRKNAKSLYMRNVFTCNVSGKNESDAGLCMWSYSQDRDERVLVEFESSKDYSKFLEILDHSIPMPNLGTWKDIAKRRYERVDGGSWDELSVANQKRRIVNTIRHNAVGYNELWRYIPEQDLQAFHDMAFDRTVRQIMNEFPWLADECRRQLDERQIEIKH